jgi:hypothetical protein
MLRSGTIDQAMHDAARDFQASFIVAQLDPLRAIPILRVPGSGREPELGPRQAPRPPPGARGHGGAGRHLQPGGLLRVARRRAAAKRREWAIRQGWGGRPVRQEQAQAILVAALGVLTTHFGYAEAKRAS